MKTTNKTNNPFNICTLDKNSNCANCIAKGEIACKFDDKVKNNFKTIGIPPVIIPLAGMAFMGVALSIWWPLIVYTTYVVLMFSVFEIRFLCSHCPYYPDNNKTLVCLGNHGTPKLWKYHPEPMNKIERFLMTYGIIGMIFFILPLLSMGFGIISMVIQYSEMGIFPILTLGGIIIFSLLNSLSFVSTLKTFYCNKCVNFSCPLNTVPKATVDEYLRKNPVMKEAWEKSGYKLDDAA